MKYNIIVIGGGHAGIEASCISAKRGLSVLLITSHLDLIGQLSCNPAVGGIAKGNIVREIDALGGVMARATDIAGIHFKMLNQTKGMAVWGNRAQVDKAEYRKQIKTTIEKQSNLNILQGFCRRIKTRGESVSSVILDSGEEIFGDVIICAMGTFLNGLAHIGLSSFSCGRLGEPPAIDLTKSICDFGIKTARLKTGTSPRIDGRTVNFYDLHEQKGDAEPWPFSFFTTNTISNKVSCWITKTTTQTHEIIKTNLDRSPLYTGKIQGTGPRYCPSIEDKILRFGERDGHTLFLEPEGLNTNEMYLNGLSTSLPFDVQEKMVKSISGLENAKIVRPGYAIEYDFFQPTQLWPTLESKIVKNLFFVGQINGTSGYEEAACQGLLAGINAAEKVLGGNALILSRDTAYIGVLLDDLVTKGTEEPYRMFTSRAEYRLFLRQDNADQRLMPIAFEKGLISKEQFETRQTIWDRQEEIKNDFEKIKIENIQEDDRKSQREKIKVTDILKRPEIKIEQILAILKMEIKSREIKLGIEADIKYKGFLDKELENIEKFKKLEKGKIPENLQYEYINGLLNESKNKLNQIRPQSFGQALRIPGVTPADITVLMIHLSKQKQVSRETIGNI